MQLKFFSMDLKLNLSDVGSGRHSCWAFRVHAAQFQPLWVLLSEQGLNMYVLFFIRPSIVTDHEARLGRACEICADFDWFGCNTHRINLGVKHALANAPSTITVLVGTRSGNEK